MNYVSLVGHYTATFELTNTQYEHPLSIADIERLHPFERDIYMSLIVNHLESKKEANEYGDYT